MTTRERRKLRADYNYAFRMYTLTRWRGWERRLRELNLALMQESTRRARGGGR